MNDYKTWRYLAARYACIALFDRVYGENNFTLSDENTAKMAQLMQVPDSVFQEIEMACYEDVKHERLPAIPRFKGEYHLINGLQVGWDISDSSTMTISFLTEMVVGKNLTPRESIRFGVAAYLYLQDLADQFMEQIIQNNELKAVLDYVGLPLDKTVGAKLSKIQKQILIRILEKAQSIKPLQAPHQIILKWNSAEFAPEMAAPNASRCLRELSSRGLLELLNKTRSSRVSHIKLTRTGALIAERLLQKTKTDKLTNKDNRLTNKN